MPETKTRPALTAEEWRQVQENELRALGLVHDIMRATLDGKEADCVEGPAVPALIALGLYLMGRVDPDSPPVTREDVDFLRGIYLDQMDAQAADLADRIETLLPPEN